ncbi:hypothetical protein V2V90_16355 [Agrobacterium leguminum]|uniref:hypothetical protein n=1 Tax=Agrobacterium leguminum TaxID=2792015 RepID=UPI0030CD2B0B
MTRGRPISRVFAALEKMAQEEPSAPKQAKDPEALSDIRLEAVEGYGETKEWGLELARALAASYQVKLIATSYAKWQAKGISTTS